MTNAVLFYSNESKIRLIAFWVLLMILLYGYTQWLIIVIVLIIDFTLRVAGQAKFSPLAIGSQWLVHTLQLPVKPVYLPPKRFAAGIGLCLCIIIALMDILYLNTGVLVAALGFFAALESLAGICAGCYIYQLLQRFKKQPDFTAQPGQGRQKG